MQRWNGAKVGVYVLLVLMAIYLVAIARIVWALLDWCVCVLRDQAS